MHISEIKPTAVTCTASNCYKFGIVSFLVLHSVSDSVTRSFLQKELNCHSSIQHNMDTIKEELDSDNEVLAVVNIKTEPETILDEVSSNFDGLLPLVLDC